MDIHSEYFDGLPDEVTHLIFSFILDCKTLIRCMSVSKAFREKAVRITSLSIVCPGNFSSYDERLRKIYCMVKAFKFLNSLVVRVGQPKEETPSWARCMRYAEIGSSVEKFVFMAAKSGDFSELDLNLIGSKDTKWAPTESQSEEENNSRQRDCFRDVMNVEDDDQEALGDGSSDEERRIKKGMIYGSLLSDSSILEGIVNRKQLSSFCLRRVVAPTNDVLTRMLPVIHFAIVQGLNELRDAMPPFISQFPELRMFLLVDMAESITVFLREHHIDQMKALYVQELDELSKVHNNSWIDGDNIKEVSKPPVCEVGADDNVLVSISRPSELSGSSTITDGNATFGIQECSGSGSSESILSLSTECDQEIHVAKLKEKKGKSIMTPMINGTCTYRRKKGELQTMFPPLSRSYFHKNMGISKGKSKALEHSDILCHMEGCSQQNTARGSLVGTPESSVGGGKNVSIEPSVSNMDFSSGLSNLLHLRNAQPRNAYKGNTAFAGFYPSGSLNMNDECSYIQDHGSESENKLVSDNPPAHCIEVLDNNDGEGTILSDLITKDASKGLRFDLLREKDERRSSENNSWLSYRCPNRFMGKNTITRLHHENSNNLDQCYNDGSSRINDSHNDYITKCNESRSDGPLKFNESLGDDFTEFDKERGNSSLTDWAKSRFQNCNEGTNQTLLESIEVPTERSFNYTEICRRSWQERVTRLRDCLRVGPFGQENSQHHRERSRELLRKRQLAMEQDALSFDYTFWRSDRISSCNYEMSDISMCIVTNAAKPLGAADKLVLTHAALAGPLLVATVSHVTKQYTCHNL